MSLQAALQFMLHLTDDEAQEAINFFIPHTYNKNTSLLEVGKEANQLFSYGGLHSHSCRF
ncbi:hypothetical protein QNH98_13545 [Myroides sp. mNGS23_01]|nr:hypothetical protein [Myroides sp. mNGS23_01]WHT38099.1 hypothetical protein QNH98_13545 [Myroides sp. mNGS23_01]